MTTPELRDLLLTADELQNHRDAVRIQADHGSDLLSANRVTALLGHITALTTERDALREANAWQPIETAPRDGTKILVFTHRENVEISKWFESYFDEYEPVEGTEYFRKVRRKYTEGWNSNTPTHWRPLPAPPAEKEG